MRRQLADDSCSPFLLARLESAYSLIWDAHEIGGQGGREPMEVFMISGPIYQDSDW